jgi:hypothetical protein
MAMIEPMGRGEEPQVLVTVAKKALCPLVRQSLKERKTMTSIFSIYPPRVEKHLSHAWMIISRSSQHKQFNDAKNRFVLQNTSSSGYLANALNAPSSSKKTKMQRHGSPKSQMTL